jgi:hypothetical protein
MCNHCETTGIISIDKYVAENDETCEFISESDEEELSEEDIFSCFEKPEFIVTETYVEEHLCEKHMKIVAEEDESGFLIEAAGLGSSRLEPIESGEKITCQYFDLLNPDAEECQSLATYALIVETESVLCAQHLEEYKDSDD